MSQSRHPRRTPEQWQALVAQWQQTEQSARQFCAEQGIGYSSFCQWRKRLTTQEQDGEASFIDLSALGSPTDPQQRGWDIVLSLGHGVELRLSQR